MLTKCDSAGLCGGKKKPHPYDVYRILRVKMVAKIFQMYLLTFYI